MKKLLLIGTLVGMLMALTVSSALAAQGQITEVNPSGVGITKALGASGGKVADGLNSNGKLGPIKSPDSQLPPN